MPQSEHYKYGDGGGGGGPQATHAGTVVGGDAAAVDYVELVDGDTLAVSEATLVLADGGAVPTGADLTLATPGVGSYGTVLTGDGATVYVQEAGEPLASVENTWAETRLVVIAVDNGNWNAGSGANRDVLAKVAYEVA